MENFTEQELIARIRRSDQQAFYLFCRRHWKSLYVPLLVETGDKDKTFEYVMALFLELWDKRKQLTEMTATIEEYIVANGLGKQYKRNIGWQIFNFMDRAAL